MLSCVSDACAIISALVSSILLTSQLVQLPAPLPLLVPAKQSMQDCRNVSTLSSLCFPLVHILQLLLPSPECFPSSHTSHSTASIELANLPLLHSLHSAFPSPAANFPLKQLLQTLAPAVLALPAAQLTHTLSTS